MCARAPPYILKKECSRTQAPLTYHDIIIAEELANPYDMPGTNLSPLFIRREPFDPHASFFSDEETTLCQTDAGMVEPSLLP